MKRHHSTSENIGRFKRIIPVSWCISLCCSLCIAVSASSAEAKTPQQDDWIDAQDKALFEQEQGVLQKLGILSSFDIDELKENTILRATKLSSSLPTLENEELVTAEQGSAIPTSYEGTLSPSQCAVKKDRSCGIPVRVDTIVDGDILTFGGITIRDDMPLALVSLKDVSLVTGPGKEYMSLSQVPLGTRVAIENRADDWYRVITEDGIRGWMHSNVLLFGPDSRTLPTIHVKVRGVELEEDQADWSSENP